MDTSERHEAVKRFQSDEEGTPDVLLLSDAGSAGLNLQRGSIVVFLVCNSDGFLLTCPLTLLLFSMWGLIYRVELHATHLDWYMCSTICIVHLLSATQPSMFYTISNTMLAVLGHDVLCLLCTPLSRLS
jgi:hypothetical protein